MSFDSQEGNLVLAATLTWVACTLCLRMAVSWPVAAVLSLLKISVPVWYFSSGGPTWTIFDDIVYFENGRQLIKEQYDPVGIFFNEDGLYRMFALSDGIHFTYTWWNLLSQYLFGTEYFAPVLMNSIAVAVSSVVWVKILRRCGFGGTYSVLAGLFGFMHWEILAWSSLLNIKDILLMMLLSLAMLYISRLLERQRWRDWGCLAACFVVLNFTRFYIPMILGLTLAVLLLAKRDGGNWWVFVCAMVAAGIFLADKAALFRLIDPINFVQGVFQILLSPRPWGIDPGYGYLELPAILTWSVFPLLGIGMIGVWNQHPKARFALIILSVLICLYAIIPTLAGPRHRIQLLPFIAWLEFHGIWVLRPRTLPLGEGPPNAATT